MSRDFFERKPAQREKRMFRVAALDTETHGLNGLIVYATAYHEDWDEPRGYLSVAEMLDDVFDHAKDFLRKAIWYSHNAEYDWRYFIDYFKEHSDDYEIVPHERAKGKFYQITVFDKHELTKSGKFRKLTTFRDSMALFPFSLAKFTELFAPKCAKQNIGLSYRNFDPTKAKDRAYALNDVYSLVTAILKFDDLVFEHYHVHIRGTISATAYNAMLRFLPENQRHCRVSKLPEDFFRKCYHGGRVFLNTEIDCEHNDVEVFDINSSYPASMRKGVPFGKPVRTAEFIADKPGFYHAVATVPDNLIVPPVPYVDDMGSLSFPTGAFETYLSSIEIERAVALGCDMAIITGFVFESVELPFNQFVDVCEHLRGVFKGKATEIVVKLMQNSVYGKFGTKPEGRECIVNFEGIPDGYSFVIDEDTRERMKYIFYKNVEREAEYMIPHYAAWITAHSRLALDDFVRITNGLVFYGDTDSGHASPAGAALFRESGLVGSRYGEFKHEKTLSIVRYHSPKSYTYIVAGKENEGLQATYKGIPKKSLDMPDKNDPAFNRKRAARDNLARRLHNGERPVVSYPSTTSLATYMKTGKMQTPRVRRPTDPHKVKGHIIENGKWRPRREMGGLTLL